MSTRRIAPAVAVLAVALVSINLRPGASSIGPVLDELRGGLGLSGGAAGLLTGLPGLCFGIFGALAVVVARRIGVTAGITLGLVAVVVGLVLRAGASSTTLFLALSVLALAGMALGNVLVPAWIKTHADGVFVTTVYGTGLIVGGGLAAGLTAPVAATTVGWQGALAMWGWFAVLALPIWLWLSLRERGDAADRRAGLDIPSGKITHSPTAIALAAMFGIQSMHAYIQFGWLPQIYRDAGLSASYAGALQAMLTWIGVVGALLMPTVISRARTLTPFAIGFGVLLAVGYLGLIVAPTTVPWLWALTLGVSGFAFPTVLALLTARTRTSSTTAQLSGFVQPVGYLAAGLGPILVGVLHDATGSWTPVLWVLAATSVPLGFAGVRASRATYVDDEIA